MPAAQRIPCVQLVVALDGGAAGSQGSGAPTPAQLAAASPSAPVSLPDPTGDDASRPTFPVKVDAGLTVERLCELGLNLAAGHCRDSGVPFAPPSRRAADYAVHVCSGDRHAALLSPPLTPARHGGASVRRQLLAATGHPSLTGLAGGRFVHVAMLPSAEWRARRDLESAETLQRHAVAAHASDIAAVSQRLAEVGRRKAAAVEQRRRCHDVLLADMEEALFGAFAAVNAAGHVAAAQRATLAAALRRWDAWAEECDALLYRLWTSKRDYFARSGNAVAVMDAASRRAAVVARHYSTADG